MENRKNNTPGKGKNLKVITAIAVAVCIVINILVGILPSSLRRIEVSKDNVYSVSEDTKKFLDSLSAETVAYVVDADGSDRRFEYFMEAIGSCSEKLKVEFVKSGSEKIQNVINENGITSVEITPYSLIVTGKNGATFIAYENMMYYIVDSSLQSFVGSDKLDMKSYRECLQYVESGIAQDPDNATSWQNMKDILLSDSIRVFYGEEIVCKMAEYVNVDYFPARYYIMGHGETELSKTELGYNMAILCQSYSISSYKALDTTKLDSLPEDAVALVILDPKSDFSEAEAQMFIDFVKAGGDITLITSNDCLSMPNVMSVAKEFGLSAENGLITEEIEIKDPLEEEPDDDTSDANDQEEVQGPVQTPEKNTEISDSVQVTPNTNHGAMAMFTLDELSGIYPRVENANSIEYRNIDPNNVLLTPLLTTSDKVMLDGEQTGRSLATAVIADYITTGGMLAWFTGAESYCHEVLASDTKETFGEDEYTALYGNIYSAMSMVLLSPTSYDSFVPKTLSPKPFANDVLNVTDKSFVAYTLIMIVLVIGVASLGAGIYYTRKKK